MAALVSVFLKPPLRLRAIPDDWARWLRPLWILLFGFSILVVVVSAVYSWRASYSIQPTIYQHGLDFEVSTDGDLTVGTLPGVPGRAIPIDGKVVAVDGKRVPPGIVIADLKDRLAQARGPAISITLQRPDGQLVTLPLQRREIRQTAAEARERNLRIWVRMLAGLIACTALLTCSFLLAFRRPNDPVAMLLAFAFAGIVGTIDPPLQYWLWTDLDFMTDIIGAVFFYVLLIGLAAFPDGVFVPRFLRWLVPLGIPIAILTSVSGLDPLAYAPIWTRSSTSR